MTYANFTTKAAADEFLAAQKLAGFYGYVLTNRSDSFEVRTWK